MTKHTQITDSTQASDNVRAALDLAAKGIPVLPWRMVERKSGKWDKVPHPQVVETLA